MTLSRPAKQWLVVGGALELACLIVGASTGVMNSGTRGDVSPLIQAVFLVAMFAAPLSLGVGLAHTALGIAGIDAGRGVWRGAAIVLGLALGGLVFLLTAWLTAHFF